MAERSGEVEVHAGLTKDGVTERVILHHRIPHHVAQSKSTAEIEAFLAAELQNVSLERASEMYGALAKYSYVDVATLKQFTYGDTILQATLPYCLYFPNGSAFEVHVTEEGYSALVTLQKLWARRADGSSEADFTHDSRPIYFMKNSLKTPQFPIDPALGWEQNYTGINVEKLKDTNGVFRYTDVVIALTTGFTEAQLDREGSGKAIIESLTGKAITVVNRVLDTYRYVTRESHVERVGSLNVHNVYLTKENVGYYVMSMLGTGIRGALMNHPRSTAHEIARMLDNNLRPAASELLQLDAEASLDRTAFTLAVVKSFQALELFVENFVLDRYKAAGLTEDEGIQVLDVRWRTKERLKDLMRDVSGHSCSEMTSWQQWNHDYDRVRNELIHRGKEASAEEAKRVVELNAEVTQWIKALPPANTGVPLAKKLLQKQVVP